MAQTVTLTLPDSVWLRLNRAAELTHRSVDEIVASTVEAALTVPLAIMGRAVAVSISQYDQSDAA